jgi:hypothetical protein
MVARDSYELAWIAALSRRALNVPPRSQLKEMAVQP